MNYYLSKISQWYNNEHCIENTKNLTVQIRRQDKATTSDVSPLLNSTIKWQGDKIK